MLSTKTVAQNRKTLPVFADWRPPGEFCRSMLASAAHVAVSPCRRFPLSTASDAAILLWTGV